MIAAAIGKHLASVIDGLTWSTGPGGNVFLQQMPSAPDVCVGVFAYGGTAQPTRDASDSPSVQVRCRGPERNVRAAHDVAAAVCAAMACMDLVTLDEGGPDEVFVIACTPAQSAPVPLGMDQSERFEFVVNLDLEVVAPTAHRPLSPAP